MILEICGYMTDKVYFLGVNGKCFAIFDGLVSILG